MLGPLRSKFAFGKFTSGTFISASALILGAFILISVPFIFGVSIFTPGRFPSMLGLFTLMFAFGKLPEMPMFPVGILVFDFFNFFVPGIMPDNSKSGI